MNISTTDAQGLFTKKLIDVYKERTMPTNFLARFFPPASPAATLEVSIEVQRGTEKIAVDVVRGSDGNRNNFGKSTEKIFIPPYFREYFDITSLDFYDRLFGSTEISDAGFAQLINSGVEKMQALVDKIDRRYEYQRAEVLTTGIVTLSQGVGQIDFKRKAGSLVDLVTYWATNNDLFAQIQTGCIWLRKFGKVQTQRFNLILGETAIAHMFANTVFLARQNFFNMKLDSVAPPLREQTGGVYHGTLTAGPYLVDVWSYGEFYEDTAGVMQPYLDPKKGILLPSVTNFKTAFAAVPQLLEPGQAPKVGQYVFSEYTDEKRRTREFHVESAGIPIPTAIDQIYTFKAVA